MVRPWQWPALDELMLTRGMPVAPLLAVVLQLRACAQLRGAKYE